MSEKKVAWVFPGQGAQYPGMGKTYCENFLLARKIFELADHKLGFPLSKLCFESPESELNETINAQPAILTESYALLLVHLGDLRRKKLGKPSFMAGHSLGQYTAFVAADAINFTDALFLVRERGRLMQEVEEKSHGGMIAVFGNIDKKTIDMVCKETDVKVSNVNCPGQIVVSGANECLAQACELISEKKGKTFRLKVGGAFHSRVMESIIPGISRAFTKVKLTNALVPIVANSTAEPIVTADEIKEESINQLSSAVLWQPSIEYMINREVSTFVEIGPGNVLSSLIKRIDSSATVIHIKEVQSQ